MSRHLEEGKPSAIEMENVELSAGIGDFKDEHQAVVAAATVPVGGVYLTQQQMKMVRRGKICLSGKSELTLLAAPQGEHQVRLLRAVPLDVHVSLQRT
jgi:hypothetical protein